MSDALYADVQVQFDEQGMLELILALIAINGWNRLAIGFCSHAGSDAPAGKAK